jgi:hypothetical protein
MARDMIQQAAGMQGEERDQLLTRGQLYAGYADHFLQDSFAAGHLINKTLIMQWYVEWLASSRIPVPDRRLLAAMTFEHQPLLHGPSYYSPEPGGTGPQLYPKGNGDPHAATDPQTAIEAGTMTERIEASGVAGNTVAERRAAYAQYLAFLGSSVAQLAAGVVHGYFNKRSLIVASQAHGPRYRIWGDRTLFAGEAGAAQAAEAAHASRRAIAELLRHGETDISSRQIFDSFPRYVEANGRLLTLPEWHDTVLRQQCFEELFSLRSTQASRSFFTLASRSLGVPSEDYKDLRAQQGRRAS